MDPSEYIAHHLQNLSTSHQTSIFDIHVWNLDTLFWSILCGVVTIVILGLATTTRWAQQTAVETADRFREDGPQAVGPSPGQAVPARRETSQPTPA